MFTLKELNFITENDLSQLTQVITNVAIDGRKITENGLYVPIKGANNDGHAFLQQAINHGAVATLWEIETEIPFDVKLPKGFTFINVPSTYKALHQIATYYREKVNPTVIGVTGSNGKTTTKDILYTLLSPTFSTHKTEGNLNNHYGVPLTLLSMPIDTQVAVIEMGMSDLGEIEELSLLSKPNFAVITNIGESHLLQLKTRENIAKAKLEITAGLKDKECLYYDGNETLLSGTQGHSIKFGNLPHDILLNRKHSNHKVSFEFCEETYELPILGDHHAKNAAYAISIAKRLGVSTEQIKKELFNIQVTGMRMEPSIGLNNSLLLNDAYNASPVSMKGAIKTIGDLNGYTQKILILGDMLELGANEEELHRSIVSSINSSITHVFCLGGRAKWIHEEISEKLSTVKSLHSYNHVDIITSLRPLLDENTVVMAKASRGLKLDKIIEAFQQ
ncbi:UDP-N-acetylmuramoyl-tripeptide--D-alanyl-D-alanine ligase [Priestia filamentosa]|uniref:UDP-N-acetylmuramoyl-tripeptide--D-alanyl-D- alanine ligase n=1 Tax=Priestia filamentosa TaxID=1402861 RepID=UPI00397C099B